MLLPPILVYASGDPCSLSPRAMPRPIWRDVAAFVCSLGVRGSTDSEHRKHASQGESFVGESFSFQRYRATIEGDADAVLSNTEFKRDKTDYENRAYTTLTKQQKTALEHLCLFFYKAVND